MVVALLAATKTIPIPVVQKEAAISGIGTLRIFAAVHKISPLSGGNANQRTTVGAVGLRGDANSCPRTTGMHASRLWDRLWIGCIQQR